MSQPLRSSNILTFDGHVATVPLNEAASDALHAWLASQREQIQYILDAYDISLADVTAPTFTRIIRKSELEKQ